MDIRRRAAERSFAGFTLHDPELYMMQSIFSLAARRWNPRVTGNGERRDGELKMDWTKPPPKRPGMGIECASGALSIRGDESFGIGPSRRL